MRDPRMALLKRALAARPASRIERTPDERDAAVAVVIRPAADLELLLIKRAVRESDPWSGHVALPGGLRAAGDADLVATALREAYEEVGLEIDREHALLGHLDEIAPRTPRLPPLVITPVVVGVPDDAQAVPDNVEVDEALWVPIGALNRDSAVSTVKIERDGAVLRFPSLVYRGHHVWGLTHGILTTFLRLIADTGM